MSVLKNKRHEAKTEYVIMFKNLYEYTMVKLEGIPKRKFLLLGAPIAKVMNNIQNMLLTMSNEYAEFGIKLKDKPEQLLDIVYQLNELQFHLIALWNVEYERYTVKRMEDWVQQLNLFIWKMIDYSGKSYNKKKYMYAINKKDFAEVKFLNTMSQLHREIYSSIISSKFTYRSTRGEMLAELADKALYHVVLANRILPQSKKQYEERKENISIALDTLHSMQQPMLAMFNLTDCSEKRMEVMSGLLSEEISLLNNLQKSDAKRFSDLT